MTGIRLFDMSNLDLLLEELKFYTIDTLRLVKAFLPLILRSDLKMVLFLTSSPTQAEATQASHANAPSLSFLV